MLVPNILLSLHENESHKRGSVSAGTNAGLACRKNREELCGGNELLQQQNSTVYSCLKANRESSGRGCSRTSCSNKITTDIALTPSQVPSVHQGVKTYRYESKTKSRSSAY